MILVDYFDKEVIKFCEITNIPIRNGKIQERYIRDIENFINNRLKKDRAITRRIEFENKNNMRALVKNIMFTLKQEESPIEEYLWMMFIKEDLAKEAIRQYPIGKYRIDFAFPKYKLAVECDGREYHRENQLQLERDQKRDKYLAKKGWRTLRIEGVAIRKNIIYCIERIRQAIG